MSTTAVLNLGINTRQFSRGLRNAGSDLRGFSTMAVGGIALVGAAMGAGLAVAGAGLIKIASDAQETENKFNAVFSGLQKSANETSKELAKSFGLSAQESQKLLGNTGDLLTGFGFTQKSALDLSTQVQELAGDLASFQNVDATRASESITKALLGETESMKSLGVVVRQNTEEFRNSVKEQMKQTGSTEQQAKAMVIFKQITEQSKNAVGDYAKTSKQLANQLKLTGKIWADLTVGVGKFLMEVTGAEGATLGFNDAFRNMTDNLLGYLKNWQQNWGILKNWISDNILTIFTVDWPKAQQTMLKNSINNFAVFAKLLGDIFTQFGGWFIGTMSRLFSGDFNNAITGGLQEAFQSMIRWGTEVWDNLVSIFKGDSAGNEFAVNLKKGMDVAFGSKGLGETLKTTISGAMDDYKLPLEGFKSATTKLEFLKYVPKDLTKSAEDLNKALKPVDEIEKKATASGQQAPQNFTTAIEKGSVEALKLENTTLQKTQDRQLKEAKRSNTYLKTISTNSEKNQTIERDF